MKKISVEQFIKEEEIFCVEINEKNFEILNKCVENNLLRGKFYKTLEEFKKRYKFFRIFENTLHANIRIDEHEEVKIYDYYSEVEPAIFDSDSGWKF